MYVRKDHYFYQAKEDGYAARSAYKLKEIQRKWRILHGGDTVLDLGAAPGSWSQYRSEVIGSTARILGIDLQNIALSIPNAVFIQADLRALEWNETKKKNGFFEPFDLVLSDMAPKTTGIKIADQARSLELCELALSIAERELRPGGNFVCKLFFSEDFQALKKRLMGVFDRVEILRPDSTRKQSSEIFLVGLNRKGLARKNPAAPATQL